MRIFEAAALADLRTAGQQSRTVAKCKTAKELTEEIFAEAKDRGEPFARTPESWSKHWLPSKKFHMVRLPLNAAALPCEPKVDNLVLKKIHAREDKPIVVDYNKNQIGQAMNGYIPENIVIDGKHRFKAAHLRGESHIMAYVGEEALELLPGMHAACSCKVSAGGGGASGGTGGGPAPDRTVSAPGARLVAKAKRLDKMMVRRGDVNSSGPVRGLSNLRKAVKGNR